MSYKRLSFILFLSAILAFLIVLKLSWFSPYRVVNVDEEINSIELMLSKYEQVSEEDSREIKNKLLKINNQASYHRRHFFKYHISLQYLAVCLGAIIFLIGLVIRIKKLNLSSKLERT